MRTKIFSILALLVLATSFVFSSPPPPAQTENHISEKTATAKFPPGIKTLSAVNFSEAKFAIEADISAPPIGNFQRVGFLTTANISYGNYRIINSAPNNLFRKPKDFYVPGFDPPQVSLNIRPKPQIVRMM